MRARGQPGAAAPRSLRSWPLVVVVIGVGIGLAVAVITDDSWRLGCLIIGAALGVGAAERLALPHDAAGLLQVRSKPFDVVFLGVSAAAVVVLAIAVPG